MQVLAMESKYIEEEGDSELFSQLRMHVQLFSHRGGKGGRTVCTHRSDYFGSHMS